MFIGNEPRNDKWFEEFKRHLFWQTAFVQLKFWADDDYATARVINAFTEQVLAETTLFTFQEIGDALELPTTVLSASAAAAMDGRVINQGINCFLKHTHFVVANHCRSIQLKQLTQTVVAVNHATIQIIQVAGCKPTTRQSNHWA